MKSFSILLSVFTEIHEPKPEKWDEYRSILQQTT